MQVLTKGTHPTLFLALTTICVDHGMVNRQEPAPTEFHVLAKYDLARCEAALADLKAVGPEWLETFCMGEHTDIEELVALAGVGLKQANELANDWFNDESDEASADGTDNSAPSSAEAE